MSQCKREGPQSPETQSSHWKYSHIPTPPNRLTAALATNPHARQAFGHCKVRVLVFFKAFYFETRFHYFVQADAELIL